MRRLVDGSGEQGEVVAQWAIERWDVEIEVVLYRVARGWWLENTYPIELWAGELGARAILCEDEEHGVYFRVTNREFGRLLTGEDRPVSLATPVAAQVVEYLDRVPGRWAMPPRPRFPPIYRRRFGEDAKPQAPAIRGSEDHLAPACTAFARRQPSPVPAA
jgi:hypothetical protein